MSTATHSTDNTPAISYNALLIDATEAAREIAKNWGWILAAGIVSVLAGITAIAAPVLTTGIAVTFVAVALFVVGCFNIAGLFFAEKGLKGESFLIGVVQILMSAVMAFYPVATLLSLTILIAAVIMVDGVFRIALAVRNHDLPGWGWTLAGGLAAVAISAMVLSGMPTSSLWLIGVLLGVSLISVGAARIAVALEGRRLANASIE